MPSLTRPLIALLLAAAFCVAAPISARGATPFSTRLRGHNTMLLRKGPAPQQWYAEEPPPGVRATTYVSNGRRMKAWIAGCQAGRRKPALLCLHGGFATGPTELTEMCGLFLNAGFVVLLPTFRGENGNPGNFELFLGEVDDARAAANHLSRRKCVHRDQLFAFGHSTGGAIAALLTLHDTPLRHTGSSGGLYPRSVFHRWQTIVPFDFRNPHERDIRLLLPNVAWMKIPHYAFIGRHDPSQAHSPRGLKRQWRLGHKKLRVATINGDHHSSLPQAARRYLAQIKRTLR